MDLEHTVDDHENRIRKLEDGQDDIRQRMDKLSDEVKRGNISNDESNKFLREQNNRMLGMLGGIEQKKHEAHIWTWKAIGKLAVTAGGIASIISFLLSYFLK